MSAGASSRVTIDLVSSDDEESQPRKRQCSQPTDDRNRAAAGAGSSSAWLLPQSEIVCPICLCETAPGEAAVLIGCSHAFCLDCISTYVRGKVEAGEVLPESLACPCVDPRCARPLAPQDVHRCLDAEQGEELLSNHSTISTWPSPAA